MINITKSNAILIINILLISVFATIYIGIFFFSYGKVVEKEVVVNNVNYLINDLTKDLKLLPKNITTVISNYIGANTNNIDTPDMIEKDKKVAESNDLLFNKVINISIILLVVTFIVVYYLSTSVNLSSDEIYELIIKSVLLLGCIAIVEFLFLELVIKNYYSVDPNNIKRHIVDKIKSLQSVGNI